MAWLAPIALVALTWMLHDRSRGDRVRTEIEVVVGDRRIRVGTVGAGCQSEDAELDPIAPGRDALVYRLSCFSGGYGSYVDAILTAKDRLTLRYWEQAEPLEGREHPPIRNRRTLASVPVATGARFSIKVKSD